MLIKPYNAPRRLAKAMRLSPAELLRRAGYTLRSRKYTLHQPRDTHYLPSGSYTARAVNHCLVPADTAAEIAGSLGIRHAFEDPEDVVRAAARAWAVAPRAGSSLLATPVVVVLAHVDHGKTTLLDALLGTDEASHEPGLITQTVRPSLLRLHGGDGPPPTSIAFIDTPGHEVFIGMREASGTSADAALILVALDAGLQKQTREVLHACARRRQRVVLAVSKVDLAASATSFAEASQSPEVRALSAELLRAWRDAVSTAESERSEGQQLESVRESLAAWRRIVEDTEVALLCAPRRWGLDELVATLLRSVGRPSREGEEEESRVEDVARARGIAMVIESRKEVGLGPCVVAVVRVGELRPKQWVLCGSLAGRIRSIRRIAASGTAGDEKLEVAAPGEPVVLSFAWDDRCKPTARGGGFAVGDLLLEMAEKEARDLATYQQEVANFLELRQELPLEDVAETEEAEAEDSNVLATAAVVGDRDKWTAAPVVAALRARSAGELQALLDFLRPRIDDEKLQVVSYGVGVPTAEEIELLRQAREEGYLGGVYVLSVRTGAGLRRRCEQAGVPLREHRVFHDLLTELLQEAGLPEPARELAAMSLDGSPQAATDACDDAGAGG